MATVRDIRQKVLVIEADPAARMVLKEAIHAVGEYDVRLASDGTTALEAVQEWRPDCVIVDLLVPGIDGFTLIAKLRHGAESLRTSRIVVSSGVMDSGMLPQLSRLGADAVLPRVFGKTDLAEALGGPPTSDELAPAAGFK
ncbi:MAG: response regulator [Chloroflexi bacterium]|nr:response regulator [Chloroflexota bacterium]